MKVHITDVVSLAVNLTASYFVTVSVDDIPLQLMVDSGAAVSLLRNDQVALHYKHNNTKKIISVLFTGEKRHISY